MNFHKTLARQWLIAVAVILGVYSPTHAARVTLQWDPSPDAAVVGYKVHTQQDGTASVASMDVSNTTTATIENLVEGALYSIYITAYDAARVESDPSNEVTYEVPGISVPENGVALQFGGFSYGTARFSPRGVMTAQGEVYAPGAVVTLTATAESGYSCTGWMVNSVFISGNPTTVTMNQHTLVTPVIKKDSGRTLDGNAEITLRIGAVAGRPTITVGGELGAWVLEGSNNLTTWSQVASGLTSEQLSLNSSARYAFYRVRSNPLASFQTAIASAQGSSALPRFSVENQ